MRKQAWMRWTVLVVLASGAVGNLGAAVVVGAPDARPLGKQSVPAAVAEAGAFSTNTFTSLWFLEVVRLINGRIDQNVTLAYITNTPGTFNLGPEQIVYLSKRGVSREIIDAMLDHDQLISSGLLSVSASTVPLPAGPLHPSQTASAQPAGEASIASTIIRKLASVLNPQTTGAQLQAASGQASAESIVVPSDAPEPDWEALLASADDVPEQPDSLYRVRLPYPVKLTDPIIVFHYPGD